MSQSPIPALLAPFATWTDPRLNRRKQHNLLNIRFIALCAVVSGANDCVAMAKFGVSKRAWLEKYLDLPNGIPSHDTFTRAFAALDAKGFVACSWGWVAAPRTRDFLFTYAATVSGRQPGQVARLAPVARRQALRG